MGAVSVKAEWRMVAGEAGKTAASREEGVSLMLKKNSRAKKRKKKERKQQKTHTHKRACGSWYEGQRWGGSGSSGLELV